MIIEDRLLHRYDELTEACGPNERIAEMPMTHRELRDYLVSQPSPIEVIAGDTYTFVGLRVRIVTKLIK